MVSKKGLIIVVLLVLSLFLVSCAKDESDTFDKVWKGITDFGQLKFIDGKDAMVGFLRIMVGILVFALFFEILRLLPFGLSPNIRLTVGVVLAVLSVVMIPPNVLIGISAAYSSLAALVLVGVPVVGALYAVLRIPSTSAILVMVKLAILGIALWVLTTVKEHVGTFTG